MLGKILLASISYYIEPRWVLTHADGEQLEKRQGQSLVAGFYT